MVPREECLEKAAHYEALAEAATQTYFAEEYRKIAGRWRKLAERQDP